MAGKQSRTRDQRERADAAQLTSMPTSSVFHFFARLLERRGYFVQDNKLEDFAFPRDMIAAESRSGFPDFVLKTNHDGSLEGGEFIELKDAKSYQIASFNSTLPSATKPVSSLSQNMMKQLVEAGDDIESVPQRDVYYLVRGIRRTTSSPLAPPYLYISINSINGHLKSGEVNQMGLSFYIVEGQGVLN